MFQEGESESMNEGIFLKRVTILVHYWELGKPSHILPLVCLQFIIVFLFALATGIQNGQVGSLQTGIQTTLDNFV